MTTKAGAHLRDAMSKGFEAFGASPLPPLPAEPWRRLSVQERMKVSKHTEKRDKKKESVMSSVVLNIY
jgi:hypothetical protein